LLADTNPAGDIFGGWLMAQLIRIEAWRRSRDGDDCFKVTEATFFVAIDEQRRPRPVPPTPVPPAP